MGIEIKHDGDGKLYYTDLNGNIHWIVEVQIYEGDEVARTLNNFVNRLLKSNSARLRSLLGECSELLLDLGHHITCDKFFNANCDCGLDELRAKIENELKGE